MFIHGRREERFAESMLSAGVTCYLPMRVERQRVRRRESGRRHEFRYEKRRIPFVPNYGFIAADDYGIYAAKATGLVYRIIPPAVQSKLLDALRTIHAALDREPELRPKLRAGSRCEVNAGPFRGKVGEVVVQQGVRCKVRGAFLFGRVEEVELAVEMLDPV